MGARSAQGPLTRDTRLWAVQFLHAAPPHDLTYDDVFMVPRRSAVASRYDVDLGTVRRHRRDAPDRRGQHDRDRRQADGRDGGPARRDRGDPAGHPGAGGGRRGAVREVAAPRFRHPDRAGAAPDRRGGAVADAEAFPPSRRRRRRRTSGRRRHRGRVRGGGSVRPGRAGDGSGDRPDRRGHRAAGGLRRPGRGPGAPCRGGRCGRLPGRRTHPDRGPAGDALPTRRRPHGRTADRGRDRRERRRGRQGQRAARGRHRLPRRRHRARAPGPHGRGADRGAGRRSGRAGGRGQRGLRRGHPRADRGGRRHRQGGRRPRRDVHDADDDRRRPAAVLGRPGVRRGGSRRSGGTSGPTAGSDTRGTSRWRWPPARPR